MRTRPTEKTNVEKKAPSKEKSGPLIRLPIKKTYCTKCQKLVKGKAQIAGDSTKINCPKCDRNLWTWNYISWKSAERD
jgi:RNase P subunit RPR2